MNVSCFLLRSKNARPRFRTSRVSGYTLLVTDRAGGSGVEAMNIMTAKAQKSRWTSCTSVGSIQAYGSAGLVKRSPVPLAAGGGHSGMAWGDFSSLVEHVDEFSTVFQLSCTMWGIKTVGSFGHRSFKSLHRVVHFEPLGERVVLSRSAPCIPARQSQKS